MHSVHGMGGVGKTQLATEYAHAHASDYDLLVDRRRGANLIPGQFTALTTRLGLDPVPDPDALKAQVHDICAACRDG